MNTMALKPDHPDQGPLVEITVNRVEYKIHRGHQTVRAIKELAHVPLADELELVTKGNLEPLPDEAAITIKGEEKFISHPRDGGSS